MVYLKGFRVLAASVVLIVSGSCQAGDGDNGGGSQDLTWTDTDWSGGNYESALNLETDASPGDLLLAQDVSSPVAIFSAEDPNGVQRGFYDLEVFQGKLYMAAATRPGAEDGGDIFSYDYESDEFQLEYSVYDQGIVKMRAHEGKLYIPGLDSMLKVWPPPPLPEDWLGFGNLYIYDGTNWILKETIPCAVHVFDVNFCRDRIFVTTSVYEHSTGKYHGMLFQSEDEGDTWEEIFRVEPHSTPYYGNYRRLYMTGTYNDLLFIQSDMRPPEGDVIFTYDGDTVDAVPVSPQVERSYGVFLGFDEKLFYMDRGLLHIFDGDEWDYVSLPFSGDKYAKALVVYKGKLYGGADDGILYYSPHGVMWQAIARLAGDVVEIESLESYQGRLYMGTKGVQAHLFVSKSAEQGELISGVHDFQAGIKEGCIMWDAILQPGTSVRFQLRSAYFEDMISEMPFTGPDGMPDTFYEDSGETLSMLHQGHGFMQYRMILETTEENLSPIIREVKIEVKTL
jgi:hypothetical protein